MMLLKAPQITILLQCFDARGVMRFPTDGGPYFGLTLTIDHSIPVSKQAAGFIARFIGRPELENSVEPLASVEPVLTLPGHEASLLYLMRIQPQSLEADENWPTLALGLRSMPPGRSRVAYNKGLQYFAGAATADINILEMDEEVQKRLARLMAEGHPSLLE